MNRTLYSGLLILVLGVHLGWILWVILGALVTRGRPLLRWFHIASLIYGILIELVDFPCPLTMAEDALRLAAGLAPYNEGFIAHYLGALVYPDVSPVLLTWAGVLVCAFNLAIYVRRYT
jgi:hypothetical protein